jgi:hypothetical protein
MCSVFRDHEVFRDLDAVVVRIADTARHLLAAR